MTIVSYNRLGPLEAIYGNKLLFSIYLLTIALLPLALSFVFLLLIVWARDERDLSGCVLFGLFCSVLLGLINSTKLPVSDLLEYQKRYMLASEKNIFEYSVYNFGVAAREPLYNIIAYVGYWVTGGNFKVYIFCTTFFIYFFQFKAIINLGRSWELTKGRILFVMAVLAFLAPYFSLTAHILRQSLAISLLIYSLSLIERHRLLSVAIFLMGSMIHSSVVVFLPFYFFKRCRQSVSVKTSLYVFVVVSLGVLFGDLLLSFLLSVFSGFGGITYILERVTNLDSLVEISTSGSGEMFTYGAAFVMFFTVSLYFLKAKLKTQEWSGYGYLNATLLVSAIVCASREITLVQYRFFFILYSLFPILLLMLPEYRLRSLRYLSFLSIFFFAGFFLLSLDRSAWQYTELSLVALLNIPIFIFYHWWV